MKENGVTKIQHIVQFIVIRRRKKVGCYNEAKLLALCLLLFCHSDRIKLFKAQIN